VIAKARLASWDDESTPDYLLVLPFHSQADGYELMVEPMPLDGKNTVWMYLNNTGSPVNITSGSNESGYDASFISGNTAYTLQPGSTVSIKFIEIVGDTYMYSMTFESPEDKTRRCVLFINGQNDNGFLGINVRSNTLGFNPIFTPLEPGIFQTNLDLTKHAISGSFTKQQCSVFMYNTEGSTQSHLITAHPEIESAEVYADGGFLIIEEF